MNSVFDSREVNDYKCLHPVFDSDDVLPDTIPRYRHLSIGNALVTVLCEKLYPIVDRTNVTSYFV